MIRFDIITLFPELFDQFLSVGVTRRAFEPGGSIDVRVWPLRDFAQNNYKRVDDRPYGGGPGMVLMAAPLERALEAITNDRQTPQTPSPHPQEHHDVPVVLFSPTGQIITQSWIAQQAASAATSPSPVLSRGGILICGRYEGVDQRFIDAYVTLELSLGDFVLSGGELAALVLLDALSRLQPGVLGDEQSHQQDSFSDGLLDCPHYSRPETWTPRLSDRVNASSRDALHMEIPSVLTGGNHALIDRWRREQKLRLTAQRRPDLIAQARQQGRLSGEDEKFLTALAMQTKPQT